MASAVAIEFAIGNSSVENVYTMHWAVGSTAVVGILLVAAAAVVDSDVLIVMVVVVVVMVVCLFSCKI